MTTSVMTTSALPTDCPDSIGFSRLHALVARGYRPKFGAPARDDGHVCIHFTHPRDSRKDPPPPVTLWSDGIISTNKVLWPEKYVPEEDKGPPDWQLFILPEDVDRFEGFVAGVLRPDVVDLYVKPAWESAKTFALKFLLGTGIAALIVLTAKLIVSQI